jgi:gamma-glutamylaminecyclotransferase
MIFFVYGTLKRGYSNNYILAGVEFIGKAVTKDRFKLLQLGSFPAARLDKLGRPILGELFNVQSVDTLRQLDLLEGNGTFFERQERTVIDLITGEELTAWIYEMKKEINFDDISEVSNWTPEI